MATHNLHCSDVPYLNYSEVKLNDLPMVAMIFYTVDKGLRITEMTVDGDEYKPDNATFVRLKQECREHYFNTRDLYSACDLRHNIKSN